MSQNDKGDIGSKSTSNLFKGRRRSNKNKLETVSTNTLERNFSTLQDSLNLTSNSLVLNKQLPEIIEQISRKTTERATESQDQ